MSGELRLENELLGPGPDGQLNACVGPNGGPPDFMKIATGYFDAGQILVDYVLENRRGADTLIYPIVFNYRHGVECSLKHLIGELCQINRAVPLRWLDHRLKHNFHVVKDGCRSYLNQETFGSVFDYIEQRINDLHQIDPKGDQFRFPETTKGDSTLPKTTVINIEVFGRQMVEVVDRLRFLNILLWEVRSQEPTSEYG
jgi:hypothetical protein